MNDKVTSFYNSAAANVNAGLRKYMVDVFGYMAMGLGITSLIAFFVWNSFSMLLFQTPALVWMLFFAEIGIVFYFSAKIASISPQMAKGLFFTYAVLNGVTLSAIFELYTATSVATAFFVSAAMFLSMAIYGYTTDRDLTGFGGFLFMGVIGLLIASIINMFLHSSTMTWIISFAGVIIFTGLTAYDTQMIKSYYMESDDAAISDKKAIFGALQLYLDFINLFLYVLRFLGVRRDD